VITNNINIRKESNAAINNAKTADTIMSPKLKQKTILRALKQPRSITEWLSTVLGVLANVRAT